MSKNFSSSLKDMTMDLKDLVEYRKILVSRIETARKAGKQRLLDSLLDYCDTVDIVLDAIAVKTIMEMAPSIPALTGRDFNIELLQIAMPQKDIKAIGPDTQVEIKFETEPKASTPAVNEEDFMFEISKLLSKSFTKNIDSCVNIYNQRTGKNLMPSDAWIEIRENINDSRLLPIWDRHIATMYRINGPVAAYAAVKKHVPLWSDTEISRLVEDSVKRVIVSPSEPFTTAKILEEIITGGLKKDKIQLWRKPEVSYGFVSEILKGIEEDKIENELGRISAIMNPTVRQKAESKNGRKAYVEKGY